MEIKAADVKALRDATGAGMMDAKKALVEAGGDVERAKEILREKGVVRAGKLSERSAEEGVVAAVVEGATGVLLELNCATDFVAKTERFRDLATSLARTAAERGSADVDALLAETADGSGTIGDLLNGASAELGEPVRVRRLARFEAAAGVVDAYLHQPDPHMPPKVGVLVELAAEGGDEAKLKGVAREVELHIAAMRPSYVTRDEVPADEVEKERQFVANQARESGKPENIIDKIVDGRMRDFYGQIVLLDQPYVRDDKLTVEKFLEQSSKEAGAAITVKRFARFRVGGE